MSLYDKINNDIKEAMKQKDAVRLETLRMMKSKIMTVDARGALPEAELEKILRSYSKLLKEVIEVSGQNQKLAEAEQAKKELAIVESYLPKQLDEAGIKALVDEIIAQTGAKTKADMGKIMKAVMATGKPVDGKLVNQYAASKLV